jgi:Cytochrome c oxidase subunit III
MFYLLEPAKKLKFVWCILAFILLMSQAQINNVIKGGSFYVVRHPRNQKLQAFVEFFRTLPVKLYRGIIDFVNSYTFEDYLLISVGLGTYFLLLQGFEYASVPFHINDTVFGGIFYMLTGLHGLHVIVGILFLSFCYIRFIRHVTSWKNLSLHFAAWYWHFVDVVWILLYIVIYLTPALSVI